MSVVSDKTSVKERTMNLVDPDKLRLVPGQSLQAPFSRRPGEPGQVGLFLRSQSPSDHASSDVIILQRAGLIKFNDVLLVLTMIRTENRSIEFFDLWWDYHAQGMTDLFEAMSSQERLVVHLYGSDGDYVSRDTENSFRRFFAHLPEVVEKYQPWTEVDFDRAVRGFCAQSYPRENLWELIQTKVETAEVEPDRPQGIDDYEGTIPDTLRPFYDYLPAQGHCIRIIPSMFEDKAMDGDPSEFLLPAPVKTVLRCGIRWAKGYPVAPIPFIPGHGLAVPPDDTEY
jgi:hypothetical protein